MTVRKRVAAAGRRACGRVRQGDLAADGSPAPAARAGRGLARAATALALAAALALTAAVLPGARVALAGGASYYSDVSAGAWYVTEYDYVGYVTDRGFMTGYAGTTLFGPEDTITRGQVATILYRIAHDDASAPTDPASYATSSSFYDVPGGLYYTAAINWCAGQGIITGDTDAAGNPTGAFRPEDPVTRQELATMLWRYAGSPKGGADIYQWPDGGDVMGYAVSAVSWAAGSGIMTGSVQPWGTYFYPAGDATRAQAAKMITQLTCPSIEWGNVNAPSIQ